MTDDKKEKGDEGSLEVNPKKSNSKKEIQEKAQKQAKYMCKLCEEMYDDPGMCPMCDAVLKPKGE